MDKRELWMAVPWEVIAGGTEFDSREAALAAAAEGVRTGEKKPRAVIRVHAQVAIDPQPTPIVIDYPLPVAETRAVAP